MAAEMRGAAELILAEGLHPERITTGMANSGIGAGKVPPKLTLKAAFVAERGFFNRVR